jgi:hypothetical protein
MTDSTNTGTPHSDDTFVVDTSGVDDNAVQVVVAVDGPAGSGKSSVSRAACSVG